MSRGVTRTRNSRTVSGRALAKEVQDSRHLEVVDEPAWPLPQRPTLRSDCLEGGSNAERPCPFVSCKYHAYLEVNKATGSITYYFPDKQPEDLVTSCTLDMADTGPHTLEDVGAVFDVTRERVRQIESFALAQLRTSRDIEQ